MFLLNRKKGRAAASGAKAKGFSRFKPAAEALEIAALVSAFALFCPFRHPTHPAPKSAIPPVGISVPSQDSAAKQTPGQLQARARLQFNNGDYDGCLGTMHDLISKNKDSTYYGHTAATMGLELFGYNYTMTAKTIMSRTQTGCMPWFLGNEFNLEKNLDSTARLRNLDFAIRLFDESLSANLGVSKRSDVMRFMAEAKLDRDGNTEKYRASIAAADSLKKAPPSIKELMQNRFFAWMDWLVHGRPSPGKADI